MGRVRMAEKLAEWRRRLADFNRGTLSVAEYCQQEGIKLGTFYRWRHRLNSESGPSAVRNVHPVSPSAGDSRRRPPRTPATKLNFLPVGISGRSDVEVQLPGGARILIPSQDAQAIQSVIAAVVATGSGEREPC